MASRRSAPQEKPRDDAGVKDDGYGAWKTAKVERALKQSENRDAMIPAEAVWRDLGLEG